MTEKLLAFYQRKFDEILTENDNFQDKVDHHLKELTDARFELQTEVIRKGERLSDVQKAFSDLQSSFFEEHERFIAVCKENELLKKREESHHKNICVLLSHTKEKEFRDVIRKVFKDPDEEVRLLEGKSSGPSASTFNQKLTTSDLLKEEIEKLKLKLDECIKFKSDSQDVLKECRVALESSKEKILEDEQEIRKLQKKLRSTEQDKIFSNEEAQSMSRSTVSSSCTYDEASSAASDWKSRPISHHIEDVRFALAAELHFLYKIKSYLKNMRCSASSSEYEIRIAKIEAIGVKDITKLQKCIKKSTEIVHEIRNMWNSICKELNCQGIPFRHDIKDLNDVLDVLSATDSEISSVGLSLYDFVLDKSTSSDSKSLNEAMTLEEEIKSAISSVKFIGAIIKNIATNIVKVEKCQNMRKVSQIKSEEMQPESSTDRIVRDSIDSALSKIIQLVKITGEDNEDDNGEDNAGCKNLVEKIGCLSDRLHKELNEEMQNLARKNKDLVISYESQVTTYSSNAQALSEKLRTSEALLRESINVGLGLKQMLLRMELAEAVETNEINTKAKKVSKDADKLKSPDTEHGGCFGMNDLNGDETLVKALATSSKSPRKEAYKEAKNAKKRSEVYKNASEKVNMDLLNEKKTVAGLENKSFHGLDVEKIKKDIGSIKEEVDVLERNLNRAMHIFDYGRNDVELLREASKTAKKTMSSLSTLKVKMSVIETDIKHL